ncbi:F420-dependent oxidoreductase-like protein [Nakamurella sp. UYEF19]|uniref:LLM class F420-dependent oxidoreductase n=1 Tax=Nakamurella sp. UYEF19 TaxID=1756392 RepID=UPI00339A3993
MRLGLNLGYVTSAAELHDNLELARAADRIGYDVVWVAEAYGSDAASVLGAIAATTTRIDIGSAVFQIPGRTPAMTAMTAATLDALSGGRFRLGLGVSGPQVSEGWHGVRFSDPVGRTREYAQIVQQAIARRRVTAGGNHFTLPLPDGLGKSLVLSLQPVRPRVPLYLAAVGPKNLTLTGEIADGWLAIFFDPELGAGQIQRIRDAANAIGRDASAIDISVQVSLALHDDPEQAAALIRPGAALYVGGMGAKKVNFYHGIATAMGFEKEADEVQEKFLARDYAGAAAAVPFEFIDRTSLIGDAGRIVRRLQALAREGVTTVNISPADPDPAARLEALHVLHAAASAAGVLA